MLWRSIAIYAPGWAGKAPEAGSPQEKEQDREPRQPNRHSDRRCAQVPNAYRETRRRDSHTLSEHDHHQAARSDKLYELIGRLSMKPHDYRTGEQQRDWLERHQGFAQPYIHGAVLLRQG